MLELCLRVDKRGSDQRKEEGIGFEKSMDHSFLALKKKAQIKADTVMGA